MTIGCAKKNIHLYPPPSIDIAPMPRPSLPHYDTIQTLVIKGKEMLGNGEIERALDIFEEAYILDPSNPWPVFYLSKAWATKGDYGEAREFAKRARWLFTGNPDGEVIAMRQEAYCLKALGQISESRELLEKVNELERYRKDAD
jgi:tetratricopeptide (TPR) repeat protein